MADDTEYTIEKINVHVECKCDDWKENISLVNITGFRISHNIPYTGMIFVFCPWCGKYLVEENYED